MRLRLYLAILHYHRWRLNRLYQRVTGLPPDWEKEF